MLNLKIDYCAFFLIPIFFLSLILFGNVNAAENVDADNDGLSDFDELNVYHTDPQKVDTDGDGHDDGKEVSGGFSPLVGNGKKMAEADADFDGLNDALEVALGTNLLNPDSDGDGEKDGQEVAEGSNPLAGNNDRSLRRRAEVDLSKQRLYYYLGDALVGSAPVSTGVKGMETPKGEYKIMRKLPMHAYAGPGYYLPNTKWNLEFKRRYYLHGAYWHNQFGKRPMSHGCVNIAYRDAEKLYKFLDVGDKVNIYGATPRGAVNKLALGT